MATQHDHASNLIQILRQRIGAGLPPIHGYGTAAELLGLNGADHTRIMGQVCSRIDAASFYAGWPMLALHMVRKPDGQLNPESFGSDWNRDRDEIVKAATSHPWTVPQVDDVIHQLRGLPSDGAKAIWDGIVKRGAQQPGFIAYNLHRKLRQ